MCGAEDCENCRPNNQDSEKQEDEKQEDEQNGREENK